MCSLNECKRAIVQWTKCFYSTGCGLWHNSRQGHILGIRNSSLYWQGGRDEGSLSHTQMLSSHVCDPQTVTRRTGLAEQVSWVSEPKGRSLRHTLWHKPIDTLTHADTHTHINTRACTEKYKLSYLCFPISLSLLFSFSLSVSSFLSVASQCMREVIAGTIRNALSDFMQLRKQQFHRDYKMQMVY